MDHVPDAARAWSFGSAAERYERYRPGYPGELVDAVLHHARRPVRTAWEVGAGTGKATRVFAARGIAVTALEPDPDMVRVLRRTTAAWPVRVVASSFEQVRPTERVDLVYAAAAWHWTDPATRWTRAVDLLHPGGVLALFGRPQEPADPDLRAAVDRLETRLLDVDDPAVHHPWTTAEMAAVPGLTAVERHDLPGREVTTADEYVGRLTTVSAYLVLDPTARADALRQVRAVLPDRFELDTTTVSTLARRR